MPVTQKPQRYVRSVQLLREARAVVRHKLEIAETVRHPLRRAQQAEREKDRAGLMPCAERLFAWGCAFREEPETETIWHALGGSEETLLPILARTSCGEFEHEGRKVSVESALLIDANPFDDRRLFVFRQWIEGVMITSDGRLTTIHGLFNDVSPMSLRAAARIVGDGQAYLNVEAFVRDEAFRLSSGR